MEKRIIPGMGIYDKKNASSFALGAQSVFYLLEQRPMDAIRIYVSPKQSRDETYEKLIALAKTHHLSVIENNEKIFKALSEKDNVMMIAEFQKRFSPLDSKANHLVLVNPMNMGNLGTIFRSAVAFGIEDVALIEPCADPYDPKVIRSSMGAAFFLRIHKYKTFEEYEIEAGNHRVFPFMLQASTSIEEVEKQGPWSLVFGNEAKGLDASYLGKGTPVLIPLTRNVDSLNLDNAVAIGLYEFTK